MTRLKSRGENRERERESEMGSETARPSDGDREQAVPIATGPCITEGTEKGSFQLAFLGSFPSVTSSNS